MGRLIEIQQERDRKRFKKENHLKNLHGGDGVSGLTGRWRGIYYEQGVGNPRLPLKIGNITHIQFKK